MTWNIKYYAAYGAIPVFIMPLIAPQSAVPIWRVDAFTSRQSPSNLLDAGARAYINSPRGVKVSSGRVQASKIYKWFKKDFGGNERGILKASSPLCGAQTGRQT